MKSYSSGYGLVRCEMHPMQLPAQLQFSLKHNTT